MSPPHVVKKQLFSADDMSTIQQGLNFSTRQTHILAQHLRLASGSRNIIEVGMKEKLLKNNHKLDDYFEHRVLRFIREDKKNKVTENVQQHAVVCNNLSGLVDHIVEERQLNEYTLLTRIGLDGGGGFVKVCISVFDLLSPTTASRNTLTKKFEDSGVKKVMIIGIVPEIPENYYNMKRLWLDVGVNMFNREVTIATDLK